MYVVRYSLGFPNRDQSAQMHLHTFYDPDVINSVIN